MPRILILLAALALAACQTASDAPTIQSVVSACPPSATAAIEPRPSIVPITQDEQLGLDLSGIRILGADRFADRSLSEAQQSARSVRLEGRIEQTRAWCEERRRPTG